MFESESFKDLLLHTTHFPPELQCHVPRFGGEYCPDHQRDECKLFAITDEVIDQIAETSGGSKEYAIMRLEAARCPHTPTTEQQSRLPYKED